jgi:uncharacterized protein YciI
MLVLMMGILKPGSEADVERLQPDFTQHLAQPFLQIRAAGALRDEKGLEAGFMILLEADSLQGARAYFDSDPFLDGGLYEQVHFLEFASEAGRLLE